MASNSTSTGASSTVTSSYKYDVDSNRTYEGYVASGTYTDWYLNIVIPYSITHQNATVAWDAMNRMTSFTDTGTAAPATITWKYDKAGNVRNVNAVHRTLDAQGVVSTTTTTDDYWYLYDAMNRFTTTKGQLSGGVISRGLNGMDIGYDAAGQRTSMAKTMMTSVYDSMFGFTTYTWWEQKELYTYTADGYLAQTNVAAGAASYTINDPTPPAVAAATGSGTQLATMVRDAMGRVTTYTEYQPNGTTVAYSRAATYNNKSEASSDTVTVLRGADTWVYNTTYYYDSTYNGSGTYQGGVVTKQVVTITKNGVAQTGNNTTNTYVWWDGALQSGSTYVSGATTNTSTFYYNDSGYLQSVYIQDGRPRTVSFIADGNNLILQRDEADNQSTGDPREYYYYFNGMRVGDIGNNGTSDTDYVGSVGAHTVASGTGPFRYGSAYSTQFADFDQSYDPINGLNYQSTSARYTVQDGDTLESIALQLWGDASFWYMIADANGLSGSDALVAGQTLRIPNKVHNAHNSNDVYKVYDPNEAIGDTSPTAGTPAAKPKGPKCGIFGQILLIVIAVAVTVLTYGALSDVTGPIIAGAVAGAAGSVASQVVGVVTGIQDKFSFKAVAMAAIGGAVTAGVANGIPGLSGASGTGAAIARGVLSNVITQGIGVATGLQHKFDFMGVAAAGIVAGVGHWAGGKFGASFDPDGPQNWQNDLRIGAGNMVGGIVAAAARSLVEGTNFGDNLMSVLPDVVGSTIGSIVARGIYDLAAPSSSDQPKAGSDGGKVGEEDAVTATVVSLANETAQENADAANFGFLEEGGGVQVASADDSSDGLGQSSPLAKIDQVVVSWPILTKDEDSVYGFAAFAQNLIYARSARHPEAIHISQEQAQQLLGQIDSKKYTYSPNGEGLLKRIASELRENPGLSDISAWGAAEMLSWGVAAYNFLDGALGLVGADKALPPIPGYGADIEMKLLRQYYRGDTTPYYMDAKEFQDVAIFVQFNAPNIVREVIPWEDGSTVRNGLIQRRIDFGRVENPDYDGLLGSATGIFDLDANLVGIRDAFNFDLHNRGKNTDWINWGLRRAQGLTSSKTGDIQIPIFGGRQQ